MEQAAGSPTAATLEARLGDIYAFFRRLGVDVASAEDLTQETFIIAWQNLPRLRKPEKLRSWLYGIAYRCYLQHRTRMANKGTVELTEELPAGLTGEPGSDEYLNARAVRQALFALPEPYRHPLLLVYWEELSYKEAARTLSLPLGTFAWRVHRGLNMLRDALTEKGDIHESVQQPQAARTCPSTDEA